VIVRYASLSDVGLQRAHNEDAIGEPRAFAPDVALRGWLFAVADGMGGHADGEVASGIAVRTLFEAYYGSNAGAAETILSATIAANAAVRDAGTAALQRRGRGNDESARMGTTLVACAIVGAHLSGVSVGDSRAYHSRNGILTQLTHDQTLAAEQARRGLISDDEAKRSHFRSVLLHALGHDTIVEPERFDVALLEGDTILLCSDGLHGVVDDGTMQHHLASNAIDGAARALVDAANAGGGPDNISVIVIACE
jgi:protein phosphatase